MPSRSTRIQKRPGVRFGRQTHRGPPNHSSTGSSLHLIPSWISGGVGLRRLPSSGSETLTRLGCCTHARCRGNEEVGILKNDAHEVGILKNNGEGRGHLEQRCPRGGPLEKRCPKVAILKNETEMTKNTSGSPVSMTTTSAILLFPEEIS